MLAVNFSPFPELRTERLLLKRMSPADAGALFSLRSNQQVMRYIGRPLAKTVEDALALINVISDALERNIGLTWGIFLQEAPDRLEGTIGYWQLQKEHFRAEIGYLLNPALHGRGLMKEAMDTVLQFGFATMKLHSVEANVNPENQASIRLLERCGFVREAYFRENFFFNGRFYDSAIYSLLAAVHAGNSESPQS